MTNEKAQSLLHEALHLFPKKKKKETGFLLLPCFRTTAPVLEESIYVRNLFSREYVG